MSNRSAADKVSKQRPGPAGTTRSMVPLAGGTVKPPSAAPAAPQRVRYSWAEFMRRVFLVEVATSACQRATSE
jgi:hypothetical protein